jgi:hypothetical protein
LKSDNFSTKGFHKFPGNIKKAGIHTIRQQSITFGDHQQQHLHCHGETPNHYFTIDIVVKQLTTEAFTIPDVTDVQTDGNIEQNPAEALEKYLHDDLEKVFHYLITEAHTKIQRKAIGLRSCCA